MTGDGTAIRRNRSYLLLAAAAIGLFLLACMLPWEWSFIDDSALLDAVERDGYFGTVRDLYSADLDWGLFRPGFWVWVPAFYRLPVGVAHALRVAMLVTVFAGTTATVVRGVRTWTVLAVAANPALYMGVWYPSLQELTGLCFVALGLVAHRRPWLLVACWVVAAWSKSPFAWLLVAYGLVVLLRRAHRPTALVALCTGLVTLLLAAVMARSGTYTGSVGTPHLSDVWHRAQTVLELLGAPATVLLAGWIALRPRMYDRLPMLAWVLLIGGALYAANLLLWRTDAHYASPYVLLLTLGALMTVERTASLGLLGSATRLVVPAAISAVVAGGAAVNGWQTMANVTGLRDCVLGLPEGSVIGYHRGEAAARLDGIARRHRSTWTGRVVYTGDPGGHYDYFIYQPGYPGAPAALITGPVVCRTAQSEVHQVV